MMFSAQKVANALNIFKSAWRGESSLTRSLLEDVQPGIELSNFRRVTSNGCESPSGLLNGESLNVELISDLDLFFERLYNYYCGKGLQCIIIKWVVELLTLGFTIYFSGFFLLYVDWSGLRNAKCGMDAVESGIKPCDLAKEALRQHPLTPLTLSKAVIVGYLGLFSVYWIFCFLRFFAQLKDILGIRHFYYNSLHLVDSEIQTMPWAKILEKVVQFQSSERLCVVKNLSAHDMMMRLMRKDNYLIGMINKGVLAFPISSWIPGVGPSIKTDSNGTHYRLMLTKTLEWTLNWCILQSMFDRNFCVRRDFVTNPKPLKSRLILVGLAMLLLSPFLVIFMLVYLFLRHAEQFYNQPSTALSQRWSNLSRWMFREFNEVEHLFKHRINSSVMIASDYLKQFPSPIMSIIAKFVSFVSGGFAAILIIIAFLEESLLEGHIFGRNLFWYAAVFGSITAISRAASKDELPVLDPEGAMSMVVQHTHYLPKRWRDKENSVMVRKEFETLFQYTGMLLLEEMASIFITPFLLLFIVPMHVDDILQFIADFTTDVEGVGHICSFSAFDFQKHGNSNYGSPYNTHRSRRSSQGKMEKSFLSFHSSYPSWEPDVQGKQFLLKLRTFGEPRLQEQRNGHMKAIPTASPRSPGYIGRGYRNSPFSRDTLHYTPFFQFGSFGLHGLYQMNHHDLLEWYYTCRPNAASDDARDVTVAPRGTSEQHDNDYGMPSNLGQNGGRYADGCQGYHHRDRSESYLGASTSIPLFRESVLKHHDSNNITYHSRSRWWARSGRQDARSETSFLEPPDFSHNARERFYSDNHPERSLEEQEQHLDWRTCCRISETAYMDYDLEVGEYVSLHFDDVYSSPPETPPAYRNRPSF